MASESSPPGWGSDPGRLGSYSRRAEPVMLVLAIASVPLFLLEHRHWPAAAAGWVVVAVLPVARPLRALRALQLLRGVRAFIAAHKAAATMTRGWKSLHGKALIVSSAALSAVAVLAVYEAEHAAGGSIDSLEDTLWWAVATVTTSATEISVPAQPRRVRPRWSSWSAGSRCLAC